MVRASLLQREVLLMQGLWEWAAVKPLGVPDGPRRRALIRTLAVSLLFSSAGDAVETASDADVPFVVVADAYLPKGGCRMVVGEPRSTLKDVMRFVTAKTATLPGARRRGPIVARSSTIGIRG